MSELAHCIWYNVSLQRAQANLLITKLLARYIQIFIRLENSFYDCCCVEQLFTNQTYQPCHELNLVIQSASTSVTFVFYVSAILQGSIDWIIWKILISLFESDYFPMVMYSVKNLYKLLSTGKPCHCYPHFRIFQTNKLLDTQKGLEEYTHFLS